MTMKFIGEPWLRLRILPDHPMLRRNEMIDKTEPLSLFMGLEQQQQPSSSIRHSSIVAIFPSLLPKALFPGMIDVAAAAAAAAGSLFCQLALSRDLEN